MTQADAGFEEARIRMHAQATASRERNAALRDMAASIDAAAGRAKSSDGSVTVTASASGAITAVTFTDRALDTTPTALGKEVTALIATAQQAALASAAQIASAALGNTHPLVADLEVQAGRFAGTPQTFGYGEDQR